jgi:hypothetical protein
MFSWNPSRRLILVLTKWPVIVAAVEGDADLVAAGDVEVRDVS